MKPTQDIFNFPDHVARTTLPARSFQVQINEANPATTLAAVSIVFSKDGATTLTPTTTIASAAAWQFTVNKVAAASMDLEPGIHTYDIETTDSAGTVKKYVGGTMTILPSPQ